MKNLIRFSIITAVIFSLVAFSGISVQDWKVDKAHSSVSFTVNHFFTPVTGKFGEYDGILAFDPNNLSESKADFTIKVASVSTDDKKRDTHLQSGDFFDAKQFPDISFTSSRFEKKSEKDYVVYGKLTIKNVTKEIALPFTVLGETEHPMMKGTTVMGIKAEIKLNRNDYGVGTGSWAATMVVGNEVSIQVILEVNHK
ncbi:MAG: polyisoprenoid-binding protein YceI [Cyclobacteriaceae bacterium]|jgi:polyisoprenoid-binding protein YceI